MTRVIQDSWTMFGRCMTTVMRHPEGLANAIIMPAMVMWIFSAVFGGTVEIEGFNYINFIVPAIILQTAGQGVMSTAIAVNTDMNRGVVDRFRSMPIASSAFLVGHVLSSVIRTMIATAVIIGVALLVGFRPSAGFFDWLAIIGIIALIMFAFTWLAVVVGVKAKAPENVTGGLFMLFILPFLSSGFAPIENLPNWLQGFATHQPMTPFIEALRGLMLGMPTDNAILVTIIWSVGISIVAAVIAVQMYMRKLS